jgi:phage baseplate assembly protein W
MTTRADFFTQTRKLPDLFSDLLTSLAPHPISGDVVRVKNDQAIKQSLRNLVLTNYGERMFQPTIGCNIRNALFEPNDILSADDIQHHISTTIQNHEPRVSLIDVVVQPDYEQDTVIINIVFSIINTTTAQSLSMILKRVR